MSRTGFAIRFKTKVGMTPMNYLLRVRMLLAANRLHDPGTRVLQIAQDLGYESESSFSAAFKREMGLPPRQYAEKIRRALD
jgi:AraC-like DNA-binding protein